MPTMTRLPAMVFVFYRRAGRTNKKGGVDPPSLAECDCLLLLFVLLLGGLLGFFLGFLLGFLLRHLLLVLLFGGDYRRGHADGEQAGKDCSEQLLHVFLPTSGCSGYLVPDALTSRPSLAQKSHRSNAAAEMKKAGSPLPFPREAENYFFSSAFLPSPFFISFFGSLFGSPFLPSDSFLPSPFFISFLASSFFSAAIATGVTVTTAKTAATRAVNSLLIENPLCKLNSGCLRKRPGNPANGNNESAARAVDSTGHDIGIAENGL